MGDVYMGRGRGARERAGTGQGSGTGLARGAGPGPAPAGPAPLRLRIPMKLRRHNGRKEVIVPDRAGGEAGDIRVPPQQALLVALARAHVWQRALDSGRYRNIQHIARELDLDGSYVGRILRLALLPPGVQEAIIRGDEQRSLADVLGEGWGEETVDGGQTKTLRPQVPIAPADETNHRHDACPSPR